MVVDTLGIDIGRVIIRPGDDDEDTSFLLGTEDDAMRTPPNECVFDVVPELVRRFEGRVWLVSKCGPRMQERTLRWLAHHRFFERSGVAPDQVRFCLKRPDKALHCRELGITHFIDDRVDVLEALEGVVSHRFLFGEQAKPVPPSLVHALKWPDVLALLLPTLRMESPPSKP